MRSLLALLLVSLPALAQDGNDATERALKAAAAIVAPCVARIETAGGAEIVGVGRPGAPGVRKGVGPTTGLVVGADGYVVTSAFNFANKPSTVFVTVPGRPRLVAKIVANDQTRMLTLLKIDARDLPVPAASPKAEFQVGQWSIALGRALADAEGPPSVSIGIVSALGRMNGKAVQTDAKVSPVNYGGPLVGIDGRVQGVLVPASPRGDNDTAGVEWYDSGIGFAVPLDDVFAILPRLKEGKDLRRGLLGITPKSQEQYLDEVTIGTIAPDSTAAKAGLKVGDTIIEIDGRPIAHFTHLQAVLGPKYEGDKVSVKVLRDKKELSFANLVLAGAVTAFAPPFLGILPMRDDPEPGLDIRYVFPESPAAQAGLKAGDIVLKYQYVAPGGDAPPAAEVKNRAQLAAALRPLRPGLEIKLEVRRKEGDKKEMLTVKLGAIPETLPETLPLPSSYEKLKAGQKAKEKPKVEAPPKAEEKKEEKPEDKKEIETGLLKRKNATLGREYWLYVPHTYKPSITHGVIVWLHPVGKGGKDADDLVKTWRPFLEDFHYILVGPKSAADGWVPSETEGVVQDVKEVLGQYSVDRTRVIAHGMADGGQMAAYIGFNARDLIRGVAMSGAALGTQPKDPVPNQPLAFFIVAGEKDPLLPRIAEAKPALDAKKIPTIYRPIKDFGKEYIDQKTILELCVWMDSLDKI